MPTFSKASEELLRTVHPDLVRVLRTAIQIKDFKILCGHRGEEAQHAAFQSGASKLDWPDGNHNSIPSTACDLLAYDTPNARIFPFDAIEEQAILAGVILACAYLMDTPVRWGHDWNHNAIAADEGKRLVDRFHFELILPR